MSKQPDHGRTLRQMEADLELVTARTFALMEDVAALVESVGELARLAHKLDQRVRTTLLAIKGERL